MKKTSVLQKPKGCVVTTPKRGSRSNPQHSLENSFSIKNSSILQKPKGFVVTTPQLRITPVILQQSSLENSFSTKNSSILQKPKGFVVTTPQLSITPVILQQSSLENSLKNKKPQVLKKTKSLPKNCKHVIFKVKFRNTPTALAPIAVEILFLYSRAFDMNRRTVSDCQVL